MKAPAGVSIAVSIEGSVWSQELSRVEELALEPFISFEIRDKQRTLL